METSISMLISPNSFPQAVLLNAYRVGLTGKGTCPLDLCSPHSVIQCNDIELGIGIKILVSVPQTRSSRI